MNNLPSETDANIEEVIICRDCGCSSTLPEYFTNKSTAPHCPKCTTKRGQKRIAGYLVLVAVFALVLWVSQVINSDASQSQKAITFMFFNLAIIFLPLPLGLYTLLGAIIETIVVQIQRAKLAAFIVGQEPFHSNIHIGNTRIAIGSPPYNCYTTWAFLSNRAIHIRMLITKLAGLLIPALIITLLLPNAALSNLRTTLAWREILIAINALYIIFYMRYLIKHPLSSEALWKEHYQRQIAVALERKNFADALTYTKAAQERWPEDGVLRNLYGYSLLSSRQYDEAIQQFQLSLELISNQSANGELKAMAHNNLGWAALTQYDKLESQELAKQHTERAFQMAPWLSHVQGTYAGLMLEEGNYEKALELAKQVAEERIQANNPLHDLSAAENLAICAIVYHYLDNPAEAKAHLETAKKYATSGLMIEKAQKLIVV